MPLSWRGFGCPRYPLGRSSWKNDMEPCGLLTLCKSGKKENPVWRSQSCRTAMSDSVGSTECGLGAAVCASVQLGILEP